MVSSVLRSALDALSVEERIDAADYLEASIPGSGGLASSAKSALMRRYSEMKGDPSVSLTLAEVRSSLSDILP